MSKKPESEVLERVDVADVTLVWGDRGRAKAMLRKESVRRHLERPLAERLRAALSLVAPRRRHG